MTPYLVEKNVTLASPTAVRAILKLAEAHRIFVIQDDFITLLRDGKVLTRIGLTTEAPYCVVSNTLAALSKNRLTFVTAEDDRLHERTSCISKGVDAMCGGLNCFYQAGDRTLYRHDLDDRWLVLKTFEESIKALSATATKLLVMLSTNLHVLDLDTCQDLVEVSCDVMNPVDVFWSASASSSFWFLAVVKPQAVEENRAHRILMTEVNEHLMTSEDVSPTGVPLERNLQCKAESDKMLTLADNGNVILIHEVGKFGELNLLYRGDATDTSFTAGEIIQVSKGPSAPRIALGTSNGAVAFLDEP